MLTFPRTPPHVAEFAGFFDQLDGHVASQAVLNLVPAGKYLFVGLRIDGLGHHFQDDLQFLRILGGVVVAARLVRIILSFSSSMPSS